MDVPTSQPPTKLLKNTPSSSNPSCCHKKHCENSQNTTLLTSSSPSADSKCCTEEKQIDLADEQENNELATACFKQGVTESVQDSCRRSLLGDFEVAESNQIATQLNQQESSSLKQLPSPGSPLVHGGPSVQRRLSA